MGRSRIFFNLLFQPQDIAIWNINETQNQTVYTWRNETFGNILLRNLLSSGKLDMCKVTISYSKYK